MTAVNDPNAPPGRVGQSPKTPHEPDIISTEHCQTGERSPLSRSVRRFGVKQQSQRSYRQRRLHSIMRAPNALGAAPNSGRPRRPVLVAERLLLKAQGALGRRRDGFRRKWIRGRGGILLRVNSESIFDWQNWRWRNWATIANVDLHRRQIKGGSTRRGDYLHGELTHAGDAAAQDRGSLTHRSPRRGV
jgi:hypothetical protein